MLSPINVEFDPSNGSWSVFYLEIMVVGPITIGEDEYQDYEWKALIYGFPTVGHAMSFCQPQIASQFKKEEQKREWKTELDSFWSADLKAKNDFHKDAVQVRIKQLVMVLK